jgi:hypothetical protein
VSTRPTAEDELQSAVWQAMKLYGMTGAEPRAFVISVLASARRYAAGDSEALAEVRRAVLHRESRP